MADTRAASSPQAEQSRSPTQPPPDQTEEAQSFAGVFVLEALPMELLLMIFDNLDYLALNAVRMTCSTFADIIRSRRFDLKLYRTRLDAGHTLPNAFEDAMLDALREYDKARPETDRSTLNRDVVVEPDSRAIRLHPLLELMEAKMDDERLFVRWPVPVARSALKDEVISYATPQWLKITNCVYWAIYREEHEARLQNCEGITVDDILRELSDLVRSVSKLKIYFKPRLAAFSRPQWLVEEHIDFGNDPDTGEDFKHIRHDFRLSWGRRSLP
ncbi:hypothetical protein V8E36_000153 [Tilletia maclaganii]